MLQLKSEVEQPPNCFFYVVPETGKRVPEHGTNTLMQCQRAVQDHYRANGYAVPGNLHKQIVEFCCRHTAPDRCWETNEAGEPVQPAWRTCQPTWHAIMGCLKTLGSWAAQYRAQQAPLEEQERRAAICTLCQWNVQESGCSACNNRAIQGLLSQLIGVRRQPFDDKLKSCGVCCCKLTAKIRLPLEPLVQHTRPEVLEAFAKVPTCWMNGGTR